MGPSGSRKVNWMLLVTAVSMVAAVVSAGSAVAANRQAAHAVERAGRANQLAEEANQIAKEPQAPRIRVDRQSGYVFNERPGPLCRTVQGSYYVVTGSLEVLGISNSGGRAVSLERVEPNAPAGSQTSHPFIYAIRRYKLFETADEFNKWLEGRFQPSFSPTGKFSFGLPLKLEPGDALRVPVLEVVELHFASDLTDQQLQAALDDVQNHRVSWNYPSTVYKFSGGIEVEELGTLRVHTIISGGDPVQQCKPVT